MLRDYLSQGPPLPITDLLSHPFFMTDGGMVALQDRIESYNCTDRRMDQFIDVYQAKILGQNYIERIDPLLHATLFAKQIIVLTSIIFVLHMMRNRRWHRDENPAYVEMIMGILPDENFQFWQKIFPLFFLYIYSRCSVYTQKDGQRLCESQEFANFYTAGSRFYELCHSAMIDMLDEM